MALTRINIGPIHPGVHGALRLLVDLDGDTVVDVEPHIGFLHRGVEKLVENRNYMQNLAYMEKLDYIAPLAYDDAYVGALESALGIEVKERAMYIRTVLLELQRISSHLLWLGSMLKGLGLPSSSFVWCFSDRGRILKLLEEVTGGRMSYVNIRLGGLAQSLPAGFEESTQHLVDYIGEKVDKFQLSIEKNAVFRDRVSGIGVLSKERAVELGVTGPVLRASGIEYDVRSNAPYYVYDKLHFTAQVRRDCDCFARYKVRMMEIRESVCLIMLALEKMPGGDAVGMPIKLILPNVKNNAARISRETPRGEAMFYMVADKQKPYRLSIRSPSFINLAALREIARGSRFADLFTILNSLDLVIADVDR